MMMYNVIIRVGNDGNLNGSSSIYYFFVSFSLFFFPPFHSGSAIACTLFIRVGVVSIGSLSLFSFTKWKEESSVVLIGRNGQENY